MAALPGLRVSLPGLLASPSGLMALLLLLVPPLVLPVMAPLLLLVLQALALLLLPVRMAWQLLLLPQAGQGGWLQAVQPALLQAATSAQSGCCRLPCHRSAGSRCAHRHCRC